MALRNPFRSRGQPLRQRRQAQQQQPQQQGQRQQPQQQQPQQQGQRQQPQQQQPQQQGQGQPLAQQGGGGGGSAFWGKMGKVGADITGRVVRGAIGAKAGAKLGGVVGGPKGAVAGAALIGAGAAVPEAFDSLQKTTTALKDTVDTASTAISTTRETVKDVLKAPVAVYGEGKTALVNVGKGFGHGVAGVAKGTWTATNALGRAARWSAVTPYNAIARVRGRRMDARQAARTAGQTAGGEGGAGVAGQHSMGWRSRRADRKTAGAEARQAINERRVALTEKRYELNQRRTAVRSQIGSNRLTSQINRGRISATIATERSRNLQVRQAGVEGRRFDRAVHGVPVLRRIPLIGRPFRGEAGQTQRMAIVQKGIRLNKARRAFRTQQPRRQQPVQQQVQE